MSPRWSVGQTDLRLDVNQLTGEISDDLGALSNLGKSFFVKCGRESRDIGSVRCSYGLLKSFSLSSLVILKLTDNQFGGTLPDIFGSLSDLVELFLVKNNFIGSLPSSMASLVSLEKFMLAENEFTGSVPEFLSSMPAVQEIYFPYVSSVMLPNFG